MGKRTLHSCWKQYKKLSGHFFDEEKDQAATIEKLETLTERTNSDDIGGALYTLFVKPYTNKCSKVAFIAEVENGKAGIQTKFDEETGILHVNPLSVFQFMAELKKISPTAEIDDFVVSRHANFLLEIGKLNSLHILFLVVLQRVAYLLEIAHLEKRGGIIEVAEDESYHTLLWAFKELEAFLRKTYGMNIRAHYGISWYESDWITGK